MAAIMQQAFAPGQQQGTGGLSQMGLNPGQGRIPLDDGYEVAKIYREARERILEELKAQVEVNRRLSRELIELRLEVHLLKRDLADAVQNIKAHADHIANATGL